MRRVLVAGCAALLGIVVAANADDAPQATSDPVGRNKSGAVTTPVNQLVTPIGTQLDLPEMRPQVVVLSPDGSLLATAGKTHELVIVDPTTQKVRQRVKLPAETATPDKPATDKTPPDKEGQVSYTGLVFSPDGKRIYLSNVQGSIKVFDVAPDGTVAGRASMPLPRGAAPRRQEEIPAGLAISADGKKLYVAMNLSNRLGEMDAETGALLRTWDVGVAPYGVVLTGEKAYVTNWGGRRPGKGDVTGPAGQGTLVRVDPERYIANEGSVSVIHLAQNKVLDEILVGLHPSGLALSPDGKHLAIANAASDTVSVLDAQSDKIVETIWTKENPATLFGASPNALTFDETGKWLFVCNGTMNCVAVIEFNPGQSELEGLIPVGWFPGAILRDATRNNLCVANIKGIGPGRKNKETGRTEHNSHQYFGSLSFVTVPEKEELKKASATVMHNCRAPVVAAALRKARPNQPPRPVPERTGEPSVFEHVLYIIKENRTYDQVLGDVARGNGDASLCTFGETITPNQHRMVDQFVLLDNTYCSGILSADGHQWADTAFATDYMEKSFADFPRSYPDGMGDDEIDALAYAPSGFIWDMAIKHKKTLRIYGEFAITEAAWKDTNRKGKPKYLDYYRDFVNKAGEIEIRSRPAIESIKPYLCTTTVGWDMAIPDVFRADQFIRELREFERKGELPNLMIVCLPNDHTSGTREGNPTPAAQVADNDLAFGQIVDAISHSKFWKKTCIFAIEDDPQAGWDHVSGYRTTAYVISPYTKRKAVIHTQYNQTSILRTIELILGLPPMNIMDASATPMSDCFTDTPDFTPYDVAPNQVPLDQMNPAPAAIRDPLLRSYAEKSATLPLEEIDKCPEDLLNRILWHAQKGSSAPYPEWAATVHDDD